MEGEIKDYKGEALDMGGNKMEGGEGHNDHKRKE